MEWEVAARAGQLNDAFGIVWQWTRSSYSPYPGYRAVEGALGEYNGKFMVNQLVLRGSSLATPEGHSRITYRQLLLSASPLAIHGTAARRLRVKFLSDDRSRAGQRVQESIMNVHASALAEAHLPDEQTTAFAREADRGPLAAAEKAVAEIFLRRDRLGAVRGDHASLPEYYPTRTELSILKERGSEIAKIIPEQAGAGRVRRRRDHEGPLAARTIASSRAYVPVDISGDFLKAQANGPQA
ncbi:L-histidine N(alpha)-methyltransferase [Bradyrhizobium betae]